MKKNENTMTSLMALLLSLMLVSCASINTGSHYDDSIAFTQYRSFSWVSDSPMIITSTEQATVSPLTQKYIEAAIQKTMLSMGYKYEEVANNADFVLSYSVGTREKVTVNSYPTPYRGYWDWYWHGDFHRPTQWHYNTWTEGTLMIDIFDAKSKEPVWHGWATKSVTSKDRKDPSQSINKAVEKIFKDFDRVEGQ